MLKVVVCIGSSCHVRGSKQIVEELQYLIEENSLKDKIELSGTFCTGNCEKGVCVTVDGKLYSVSPDTTKKFFNEVILKEVGKMKSSETVKKKAAGTLKKSSKKEL